jgi:dienelactone hydrolase
MKSPKRRTKKLLAITALLLLGSAFGVYAYVTGFHRIRHEQVRISSRGAELAATVSLPRWGSGPFPAVVAVHSSGPRQAQDLRIVWRNLVPEGVVVLTYDKPGIGQSTGRFEEVRTDSSEQQLRASADDVLACLEFLKKHPMVDAKRVGLFGGSQAGWIIPIACDVQHDIPFSVILSGPATSYGLEMYFSSLTGEGIRPGSGLNADQIEQRLNVYSGLTGYEPLPVLTRMKTPTLWLYGDRDIDIPAQRSARIVTELQAKGSPFTVKVYLDGNHNLEHYSTGKHLRYWPDIIDWLRKQKVIQ